MMAVMEPIDVTEPVPAPDLASNTVLRIDAGPLTGQVSDTNAPQRGYEAELSLSNKQRLLEGINFGIAIREPSIGSTEDAYPAAPV